MSQSDIEYTEAIAKLVEYSRQNAELNDALNECVKRALAAAEAFEQAWSATPKPPGLPDDGN